MMDKRKFLASICVKVDTKRTRIELCPAENYGGEKGFFRVRISRRWLDTPEGQYLFFDKARLSEFLADLVAKLIAGECITDSSEAPDIPRNSRVSVKFVHDDMPYNEASFTSSPPYRAFDGRFYVWVLTYEAGFIAVPVENITLIKARR